ncbi:alpha/beta hydrolase [Paenarthrobacter sp. NPDC090517]|uniref:alpha/beta hydrolase n=1 Tax=Paenarthrobacter sp. NPDC090517 TaxID=3364381 RepID=UPI0037F84E47
MTPADVTKVLLGKVGSFLAFKLFHPPRKKHHRQPSDLGLDATVLELTAIDGVRVHTWIIEGRAKGNVILGHGIGLTKSASLAQAKFLNSLGYNVILFDHRNHGLSGTDTARSGLAARYSADIQVCLQLAAQLWPESTVTVVWGFSFSTFPTVYSLMNSTHCISAVICDSGPGLDLVAVLEGFLTGGGIPAPFPLKTMMRSRSLGRSFASAAVDMLEAEWPPDPGSAEVQNIPMLYLVGADDAYISAHQTEQFAALYAQARVAVFPAGHLQALKTHPDLYVEAVSTFLEDLQRIPVQAKPTGTPGPRHPATIQESS